jgi:uncharacterized membrane protein
LLGLDAAIIIVTISITAARYYELPERIPIHFTLDGTPNSYGPRATAWLLPASQLLLAAIYATLYKNGIPAMLVVSTTVLLVCCGGQILILQTATSGADRASMGWFWIFLAIVLAAGVSASRFLR